MNDFEFVLKDRMAIIRDVVNKYGEQNFYLSFSGGKDSTILHYLLDMALPNNTIPRVFINTGIEYILIVDFVKKLADKDSRFVILKPSVPVKPMLESYGYPFKSKEFANIYKVYQNSGKTKSVRKFIGEEISNRQIVCPKMLRSLFEKTLDYKISDRCCMKMKKEPIHKWEKDNNCFIGITGMRKEEGGQRQTIKGCAVIDSKGKLRRFHPLLVVDEHWEEEFIKNNKIELCALYGEPYNFKRTGCKGCPFSLDLQQQLEIMEKYLPNERQQCEFIWKPIYEEYRRLNYRLKNIEKIKLF